MYFKIFKIIKKVQASFANRKRSWKRVKLRESLQFLYHQMYRTNKIFTTYLLLIFININACQTLPIVNDANSKIINVNSGKYSKLFKLKEYV